jgi:hypothetical protein
MPNSWNAFWIRCLSRTLPMAESRSTPMQRPPAHTSALMKSTSMLGTWIVRFQSHSLGGATHSLILLTVAPASVSVTAMSTHLKKREVSNLSLPGGGANERQTVFSVTFSTQMNPRNRSVTRVRIGLSHSPAWAHCSISRRPSRLAIEAHWSSAGRGSGAISCALDHRGKAHTTKALMKRGSAASLMIAHALSKNSWEPWQFLLRCMLNPPKACEHISGDERFDH